MTKRGTPFPRPRESSPARLAPHERRFVITYKLAKWDPIVLCFRDGKQGFESEAAARAATRAPGRYRVSEISDGGRRDLEPFEV